MMGSGAALEKGRSEERASAVTACVSVALREIPILNCSSSRSAHNLFSAPVRRHTTICLADIKEHFNGV